MATNKDLILADEATFNEAFKEARRFVDKNAQYNYIKPLAIYAVMEYILMQKGFRVKRTEEEKQFALDNFKEKLPDEPGDYVEREHATLWS